MKFLLKSRFFIYLFLILYFSYGIYAIGIGPGTINFDYKPGNDYVISFVVKGDIPEPAPYEIYFKDVDTGIDLNKYLNCSDKIIYLTDDKLSSFSCYFLMPPYMEPGSRQFRVGIKQALPEDFEGVAVVAAVESRISVSVPYPDYYLDVGLDAQNVKVNETEKFIVSVKNWGKYNTSINVIIDVLDSNGKKASSVTTDTKNIESLKDATFKAKWKADVDYGKYTAIARIMHNNREFNATKDFLVGDVVLEIINFSAYVPAKEIGRFNVEVQSFWSENIDFKMNVEVIGKDENEKDTSIGIKSNDFRIGGWQRTNFNVYWDKVIEKPGNYTAYVEIAYGNGKNETKKFEFEVIKKKFEISPILMAIMAGSAVIFIVLILLIIVLFKKASKPSESRKKEHKS